MKKYSSSWYNGMNWIKFRQHVAWRRGISPAKAEKQVSWLDSEGQVSFGQPMDKQLERRDFGAEDIVTAVQQTAERERLEKLRQAAMLENPKT